MGMTLFLPAMTLQQIATELHDFGARRVPHSFPVVNFEEIAEVQVVYNAPNVKVTDLLDTIKTEKVTMKICE